MATTIDDLAARLHEFFVKKIGTGGGETPGDLLIVFDALGLPMDPLEFGARPDGPPLDVFANQRAAELADQLPAGNVLASGSYLARSGSRLSRWYAEVLQASQCTSEDESVVKSFNARRAEASQLFDENKVIDVALPGSGTAVVGEHDAHYATSMSPRGWFLPESQAWTRYSQSADEEAQAESSPPLQMLPLPEFKLRVAEVDPPPGVREFVTAAQNLVARRLVSIDSARATDAGVLEDLSAIHRVGASIATPTLVEAIGAQPLDGSVEVVHAHHVSSDLLGPFHPDHPVDVLGGDDVSEPEPAPDDGSDPTSMSFVNKWRPEQLQLIVDATETKPVQTEGFALSFEYTIVLFERPWWYDVFLANHDWKIPGFDIGALASGKASPTASQFITMVTAGMVVIRDLEIKASWHAADLDAAPSATSLGPFCIAGATWNEELLCRPGLQVIAWICQVPQTMPPS